MPKDAWRKSGLSEQDFAHLCDVARKTGTIIVTYPVNLFATPVMSMLGGPNKVAFKNTTEHLNTSNWGLMVGLITSFLLLQRIKAGHYQCEIDGSFGDYQKQPLILSSAWFDFLIREKIVCLQESNSSKQDETLYFKPVDPHKPQGLDVVFIAKRIQQNVPDNMKSLTQYKISYCINGSPGFSPISHEKDIEILCDKYGRPVISDLDLFIVIHPENAEFVGEMYKVFDTADIEQRAVFLATIKDNQASFPIDEVALDDSHLARQGGISPFQFFISHLINAGCAIKVMHGPASSCLVDKMELHDEYCVFAAPELLKSLGITEDWFKCLQQGGGIIITKENLFKLLSQLMVQNSQSLHIPLPPSCVELLSPEAQVFAPTHVVQLTGSAQTGQSKAPTRKSSYSGEFRLPPSVRIRHSMSDPMLASFSSKDELSIVKNWCSLFSDHEEDDRSNPNTLIEAPCQ